MEIESECAASSPTAVSETPPIIIHADSILQIRQYSERAKAVYAWGKKTITADKNFAVDAFGDGTFEALSGICAARGARETGLKISSAKFVTHPSSLVRSQSVSSGLLSPDEAKAIFLSEDSSRDTQRMLVRTCGSLPSDEDTMALARKLDEEGMCVGVCVCVCVCVCACVTCVCVVCVCVCVCVCHVCVCLYICVCVVCVCVCSAARRR